MTPTIPMMKRTTIPKTTIEVHTMPTVKLRFPGGRYHATPWGHHVNEGLIEWPPSPWRLLRAFVACGYCKLGWPDEKSLPDTARNLIHKLAGALPFYHLPHASPAHSRHVMPTGSLDKGRERTTLVFDTWANVGDGELLIHWPCQLGTEETELLGRLIPVLGYLGRSESWVEAELTDAQSVPWNVIPCEDNEHRCRGWEQVSLMCAIPQHEYQHWREKIIAPIRESIPHKDIPAPGGKRQPTEKQLVAYQEKLRKANEEFQRKLASETEPYPPDLITCLQKDTAWWKGHGWSQPPGSRRMLYWRRSDALQVGVPSAPRPATVHSITTMLLAMTTPSGNRSALPPVQRTLPQAELFHRAIIGRLGKGLPVNCPELTGKNEFNKPLHDRHEHAHTIPVDLDGDGHIDHIIIYASMGLGDAAQRAIRTLRRTWTKGGVGDLQLAVVGGGDLEMLRKLPHPLHLRIEEILGSQNGACVWKSWTPFVPPRFLKERGKNTLEGQVQAELTSRGLPMAERVETAVNLTQLLRHFVRKRNHGGTHPKIDMGFGLRLFFKEPIHGPLLLGYACHYGLGMFQACSEIEPIFTSIEA
jgi:CRISPR-associated protein Csb2